MKIKYLLISLGLIYLSACNKHLDQAPPDKGPDKDAIVDMGGLNAAVVGMYSKMRDLSYYGGLYLYLPEIMGDNVYISANNSNRYLSSYRYNWVGSDGDVTAVWNSIYSAILSANNIINDGPNVPAGDDEVATKNSDLGQAYFIRALEHFDLVRFFAQQYAIGGGSQLGVPYVTQKQIGSPARNSVAEVYEMLIADLRKAESLLPDVTPKTLGRYNANKDAVHALLSRVYLYRGDNDSAVVEATKVVESAADYSIIDAVANPSGYMEFYNTPGTAGEIFTLHFLTTNGGGSTNYGNMYLNDGYGDIKPSTGLINSLDPADIRREFVVNGGNEDQPDELENLKFTGQENTPGLYSPKILRIEEVYLNRAEANAKLGQTNDALDDLNEIRTRRGLSILTGVSGKALVDSVLRERQIEFMFEGTRYFDLMRNELDVKRSNPGITNVLSGSPTEIKHGEDHSIVPIPARELNSNNNMDPNPGYGN